jgi:hypothetical protein
MDDLQSYVFDNSEDFSEKHYINLMALILKAHNQISICKPDPPVRRMPMTQLQWIIERNSVDRILALTQEQSDSVFALNYPCQHMLIDTLSSFFGREHWNRQSWLKTDFIFPVTLTNEERQMMHILCNVRGSPLFSVTNHQDGQLNIIL